ncbi:hypothetical protein BGZ82_010630 [Podila clonocystis]|nr:hypothetical protein BGZ82_010630 [Podila clonocystis]
MAATDDTVFVDMASGEEQHLHHDEEEIPPYQESDAYKPLLGDAKVDDKLPEHLFKEDPESKGSPLPDANPCTTRRRCRFVERFRARFGRRQCSDEQREKCRDKARRFRKFFRIFFGILLVTWLFGGFECDEDRNDGWIMVKNDPQTPPSLLDYSDLKAMASYDEISNGDCGRDLVPWKGVSFIETDTRNLNIGFGKGNMASNLVIRTGDVDAPTLFLRANVTDIRRRPDDDDDNVEEGLHVDLTETDDSLDIQIWADQYVHDDDNDDDDDDNDDDDDDDEPPRRHPKHHKKHKKHHGKKHHKKNKKHHRHHDDEDEDMTLWKRQLWTTEPVEEHQPEGTKKFCALIEAELVLPAGFETYGRLTIGGLILNINAEDSLHRIAFGELALRAVIGEVNAGHVSADVFRANTITSPIRIDSVRRGTRGLPLDVEVGSVLGSVHVETRTNHVYYDPNEGGDDDDNVIDAPAHKVAVSSAVGEVQLTVSAPKKDLESEDEYSVDQAMKVIPGYLFVDAKSTTGYVEAFIDLQDKQGASIEAKSANNDVAVVLSDKFLGEVEVKSTLKKAYLYEADDSESQLDWFYKTPHRQHALKYIKDKQTPADQAGRVHAFSTFGEVQLQFLKA